MNHILKKLLSIAIMASTAACTNICCTVTPYIYNRSVSENAARELSGWAGQVNLADMDKHYGSFSATTEYTRSFRPGTIAKNLFGCDLQSCNTINIKGSAASPRLATDWLAEWFFLPSDYNGSFSIKPMIQNALVDLNFYWGMDRWADGLYFRIHAPIAWTKWDLGMCMGQETAATTKHAVEAIALNSFLDFSCNQEKPASIENLKFNALNYSRLCPCAHTKTRLSDIQADFGWNFLQDKDYHLGLFVRAVAPTGNRPHGIYLFEPIIGNGHHWELGGGATAHAILWRSKEKQDKHVGLYVDANITHLFNAKQCRFFDLCNNPWSRYMFAIKETLDSTGTPILQELAPIANLTAHAVNVSIGAQADIAAMLNYTNGNYSFDLGYNFWGRSCEKFSCDTCNTCKSCSTCKYPTFYSELDSNAWYIISETTIHTLGTAKDKKYLSTTDLDVNSARTKGISHKLFTHFAYTWHDKQGWIPYLGIGGELEFGDNKKCCDTCTAKIATPTSTSGQEPAAGIDIMTTEIKKSPCCNTTNTQSCCSNSCGCINTAISQWGIWLKGGVSF